MSAWPSRVCTTRRSAPPSSRWVAKAWRSTWGLTRAGSMPAPAAASSSSWAKRRAVSRPALPARGEEPGVLPCRPWAGRPGGPPDRPSPPSRAVSFSGASRSLPPLPRTIRIGRVAGQRRQRQRQQLGDPQARGVDQLDHAAEPQARRAVAGRRPPRSAARPRRATAPWAAAGPAWAHRPGGRGRRRASPRPARSGRTGAPPRAAAPPWPATGPARPGRRNRPRRPRPRRRPGRARARPGSLRRRPGRGRRRSACSARPTRSTAIISRKASAPGAPLMRARSLAQAATPRAKRLTDHERAPTRTSESMTERPALDRTNHRPRRPDGRGQNPASAAGWPRRSACPSATPTPRSRRPPAARSPTSSPSWARPSSATGERRVIARLLDEPPHVLATGGGAFVEPETRALIKEKAVVGLAEGRPRRPGPRGSAARTPAPCCAARTRARC